MQTKIWMKDSAKSLMCSLFFVNYSVRSLTFIDFIHTSDPPTATFVQPLGPRRLCYLEVNYINFYL